jgi:hypothetical protein
MPGSARSRRLSTTVILIAVVIRVLLWANLARTSPFGMDEDSYYDVGTALYRFGQSNTFWPPVTGWLIAAVEALFHTTNLSIIRLAWIAADIGCLIAMGVLAGRVGRAIYASDEDARRVQVLATGAYAVYLPAISYAQFATSEIPAALQLLLIALLLTGTDRAGSLVAAGVLSGTLTLTRANLFPVLGVAALAAVATRDRLNRRDVRAAAAGLACGAAIIGAAAWHTWRQSGELTIARNGAYNLYIGNGDFYAEDLDLFHPRATPEQIAFRRAFFAGAPPPPALPSAVMERAAIDAIVQHPWRFARRACGRLARVFAPKTDVLALAGGESRAGIFSPTALLLLVAANIQWLVVLSGGIVGLISLLLHDRSLATTLIALGGASVPLCLIAVAKARYAFVFEPILVVAAAAAATNIKARMAEAWSSHRRVVIACAAFLAWGWMAWTIFALSSRLAM